VPKPPRWPYGQPLTELDCTVKCKYWTRHEAADRAVACCTRLESLTNAKYYAAKVWLGLTHLHSLRGVDCGAVPAAAIAAVLPRLRTLAAFISASDDHTAVARATPPGPLLLSRAVASGRPCARRDRATPAASTAGVDILLLLLGFSKWRVDSGRATGDAV
jgi:hypothetical protein